uniref:Signal recognition particle 14 kDa protein n=1 Tax=Salvator merianae TaxID=96440 RepID=A0A8D0BF31_SALMN
MVLLESKQFLTELTRLFPRRRSTGSGGVEGFEPVDNKCRLRATDGKKKISIVVSSKKINKWPTQICSEKNGIGIKKRHQQAFVGSTK